MKINKKNLGINTASCSDVNGAQEFKCECNDGFEPQILRAQDAK